MNAKNAACLGFALLGGIIAGTPAKAAPGVYSPSGTTGNTVMDHHPSTSYVLATNNGTLLKVVVYCPTYVPGHTYTISFYRYYYPGSPPFKALDGVTYGVTASPGLHGHEPYLQFDMGKTLYTAVSGTIPPGNLVLYTIVDKFNNNPIAFGSLVYGGDPDDKTAPLPRTDY